MCCKCNGSVRYNETTGQLEYKSNGEWKTVPDAGFPDATENPPDVPPTPPIVEPSNDVSCQKAMGVWQVISDFAIALMDEGNYGFIPTAMHHFNSNYPSLDEDNWQLYKFIWNREYQDFSAAWDSNKSQLSRDFICDMANRFDKNPRLSDTELAQVLDYDFDSDSGSLDGFLTDVLGVPEKAYYKRVAAQFADGAIGDCPCGGLDPFTEPTTPDGALWVCKLNFTDTGQPNPPGDNISTPDVWRPGGAGGGYFDVVSNTVKSDSTGLLGGGNAVGLAIATPQWTGGLRPILRVAVHITEAVPGVIVGTGLPFEATKPNVHWRKSINPNTVIGTMQPLTTGWHVFDAYEMMDVVVISALATYKKSDPPNDVGSVTVDALWFWGMGTIPTQIADWTTAL